MSSVLAFTKRCCLCYFRDRGAVFFSLMASLIVVMLYLLFLRDSLISGNPDIDGMDHLVDAWVLSGILGIVSVTCSSAALQTMVTDRAEGRDADVLVTPMDHYSIAGGYVLSTFIVGVIMGLAVLIVSVAYMALTGCPFNFIGVLIAALLLIPASLSGAVIMFAITSFIRTNSAFTGMYTVVSVAIGFVTGIYIPLGSMPSAIGTFSAMVPATQMSMLFRRYLAGDALDSAMEGCSDATVTEFRSDMGFDLCLGDFEFALGSSLVYTLIITAVFFGIAVWSVSRRR